MEVERERPPIMCLVWFRHSTESSRHSKSSIRHNNEQELKAHNCEMTKEILNTKTDLGCPRLELDVQLLFCASLEMKSDPCSSATSTMFGRSIPTNLHTIRGDLDENSS